MSILDEINQEWKRVVTEIKEEQTYRLKRKEILFKQLQKKHKQGNNTFYLGRDDFYYYEKLLGGSCQNEEVQCPFCLGKEKIRQINTDITQYFENKVKCPLCNGYGTVFFIFGYKYQEISNDDSDYQRW
jgi:hypothetical protein